MNSSVIAFLFSGQGAQYKGMAKGLYDRLPEVREMFSVIDKSLNRKISELCFEGSMEDLSLTHNTQPCVFACDLAYYLSALHEGYTASYVAGFSLGEYAALYAAGVLNHEDLTRIVQFRADAMQSCVPVGEGGMVVVLGSDGQTLQSLLPSGLEMANFNCPGQIVLSGTTESIDRFLESAKDQRIRAMRLPVSAPFHCSMLKPVGKELEMEFQKYDFKDASIPICMNCDATFTTKAEEIKRKLVLQAYSPVYWQKTLETLRDAGVSSYMECGPGKTLTGFVHRTVKNADCFSFDERERGK